MTQILKISPDNPEEEKILFAVSVLSGGGVVIYPTDTVYGLGCTITSPSVERIFEIKRREKSVPLSVAFSSIEMVEEYAVVGEKEREAIKGSIDEPYTFILKKKSGIPGAVTGGRATIGVRVPNHAVVRGVVEKAGVPIITTSANVSGKSPPKSVNDVGGEVKEAADLIIDSGACRIGRPSRVIDLRSGRVLRE